MRFDSYHPMINLIFFAAAFVCILCFRHPVFLMISFLSALLWSVKLGGKKLLIFDLCLIPPALCFAVYYASFQHFGVTGLKSNFIGNQITLEALVYGLVLGIMTASVLMMLGCVLMVVSEDKVVYLLGRISPRLSMYAAILLRFLPRMGQRGRRIALSRYGIGKGIRQGNPLQRIRHLGAFLSILITWTMEDFVESAASMKSRAYTLRGRTAFSIYRFDQRDRNVVLTLFFLLTVLWAAWIFDQTGISYSPQIVMNRVTPVSVLFYLAYAAFLLLPLGLQFVGEWRFQKRDES